MSAAPAEHRDIALAVIRREGRCFLQRRDPKGAVLPGLWEFPGGKVEAGESLEAALRRELLEEVGWAPERIEPLAVIEHSYAERLVRLHPFLCEGPGEPCTELAWGWFRGAELLRLPVPEANRGLLAQLAR